MEITLTDILLAREERVQLQQKFLKEYLCPLISFTMNIPGPIKNTPLIQRGFQAGLEALLAKLPAESIRNQHIDIAPTGCTAILSVALEATELKEICVTLEESTPLGRLFDMDVLNTDGAKLERNTARCCLVCGATGRGCAATRKHPVSELQAVTYRILREHFAETDRKKVADFSVQSLIDEVNTTPKPGLVDLRNNGSHQDMCPELFIKSARALHYYFLQCVKIGQETAALQPEDTFAALRTSGQQAEQRMYQVTGGVNTHKGAIYTLGILCGSIGRLWTPEIPYASIEEILRETGKIAAESVASDLAAANGSTAGERCYLQYGIGGIRAEVANGLPSVKEIGLPCYENALSEGYSHNDAGVKTLLHLIARVKDTNLYNRGGSDGAQWAANAARFILPSPSIADVAVLDDAFIERNLSPGGCADLLAVTYFLHNLK